MLGYVIIDLILKGENAKLCAYVIVLIAYGKYMQFLVKFEEIIE